MEKIVDLTLDDLDNEEDVEAMVAMISDQSSEESDSDEEKEEEKKGEKNKSPSKQVLDKGEAKTLDSAREVPKHKAIEDEDAMEKKEEILDELDKAMIEIHDGVIDDTGQNGAKDDMEDMEAFEKKEEACDLEKAKKDEEDFNDLEKAMDKIHNESDDKDDLKDDKYNMDDMDSQETIDEMIRTHQMEESDSADSDDEDVVPIPEVVNPFTDLDEKSPMEDIVEMQKDEEIEKIDSGKDSIVESSIDKIDVVEFCLPVKSSNAVSMPDIFTLEPESILIPNQDGDFEDVVIPNKDANFVASIDITDDGINEEEKNPKLEAALPVYLNMPSLSGGGTASDGVVGDTVISLEKFKEMRKAEMRKATIAQIIQNPDFEDIDESYEDGENVQDLFTDKDIEEDINAAVLDLQTNSELYQFQDEEMEQDDDDIAEEESDDDDDDKDDKKIDDFHLISGPVTFNNVNRSQLSFLDEMEIMMNQAKQRLEENLRRQQEIDGEVLDNGIEAPVSSFPSGRHVSVAKKTLTVFGAPYFKDHRLYAPPKNEDAKRKQSNKELDVYITYPHCWTTAKRTKLAASVREDAVKKRQKSLVEKRENYLVDMRSPGVTEDEKEEIRKLIDDVDKKLNEIATLPDDKLFIDREEDFDWMKISSQDFDEEFSAKGCELQWKNHLHPSINTKSFTKIEDDLLKRMAKATAATDWEGIAQGLGTARTGICCFQRYMAKHNVSVNNRKWDDTEDQRLRRVVAMCRINNLIPWSRVSYFISDRTKDQCYQRYLYSLKDDIRQGTFVPAEDFLIIIGHKRYGKNWAKICETIPGRSGVQIHARWNAFLSVQFNSWTMDEDLQLLALIQESGPRDWVLIANKMEGRTFNRSQVRNRFQFLTRNYKRDGNFTLDMIKYNKPAGIAARRQDDVFKQMREKFEDWMREERLTEEDIEQEDHTGSVHLFNDTIVGNSYVEKFVRYIQKFLPEPEEPRPLAPLQPALPKAVAHLKEEILGPVGRKVMNKLKLQRRKKKFRKLPVQKRREAYKHKVDRDIAKFFRCTWMGKPGRTKTHYTSQEIDQHTNAVVKLGEILDFSKLNLESPPDEMDPKEKLLYRDYRYFRVHGKKQNQFDLQTGQTTVPEETPTDLSLPAAPAKTIKTYSRKNKKGTAAPQAPSISAAQPKQMHLKEGEKRLTLLLPNEASMIGLRGQLLHTRYISSLANPFEEEEGKNPSQKTTDRLVQEGIFNTDIMTNMKNGHVTDANMENETEPGIPTREQADQLLVKRFTQIFLLPSLLSCKKPARQEQLFESSEFLDSEPVSASNPYDASDIIRKIEKPRVPLRKPPPTKKHPSQRSEPMFTNPRTPGSVQMLDGPYNAPESPIRPPQVHRGPNNAPESPIRPPQARSPRPVSPTYQFLASPRMNDGSPQRTHYPQATSQKPMSNILQRPLQTPGSSQHPGSPHVQPPVSRHIQPPGSSHHIQHVQTPGSRHIQPPGSSHHVQHPGSSHQMTSTPQQYPQSLPQPYCYYKTPPQNPPQMKTIPSQNPPQMRTIQTLRPVLLNDTPIPRPIQTSRPVPALRPLQQPPGSQILQRPPGPRQPGPPPGSRFILPQVTPGMPYILPKVKLPSQSTPSFPSSPQQIQSPKSLVHSLHSTPKQLVHSLHSTPKQLVPISPKVTCFSPPQLPLRGSQADPVSRKRPAEEQPVSDKAIPLKKRPVPTMRPPPPLSPNPARIAPKPTNLPPPSPNPIALSPPLTSTPAGGTPRPRPSPRPKLSRSKPTTGAIHVISEQKLAEPVPSGSKGHIKVVNMTMANPMAKQIRNPPKKSSSK